MAQLQPTPMAVRPARVALSLFAGLLLTPDPAAAQFGQASPYTLDLNHTFYFNGDKAAYALPPDCRDWADAMRAFDALRAAGKAVSVIRGRDKAASFVEHAYKERVRGVQYRDLESVFVEAAGENAFRVYTGSEPKGVVCGFDQPQMLDRIWFEAGLRGEDVPSQPAKAPEAPLSPAMEALQAAYFGQSYPVVRNSLRQRGYSAFAVPEPVAERCDPTLEQLCQTYPEAICERAGITGISCTFVFQREGKRQFIGVDAAVSDLTVYSAAIEVVKLRELGEGP